MSLETRKAGIVGAGGYTGYELIRIINTHPGLELAYVQSEGLAGRPVSSVYPWMKNDTVFSPRDELKGLFDTDIVFTCLPAGESMKIIPQLVDSGLRVVDLGPDYRLHPASAFESVYKTKHTDARNLQNSVYGLTEINRSMISEASVVANPGCYPTAALLALVPLSDIVGGSIVIDAKSGTSGAGKEPTLFTHHSEIGENIRPYSVNTHRHIAEISEVLSNITGRTQPFMFVPHLVPIVRGIEETIYLYDTDASEAEKRLSSFYADSPFVHIEHDCSLNMVSASNHCFIDVRQAGSNTILLVFIDNLMKGASGQAVQNANIMLSFPEDAGLTAAPSGVGR
ncbi:MAG: N-acetyl-gamma-glutamyl-phosphate reductase [Candidatus Thermoplasmatota archaeon]|nr:N-acetyl-gamma-glutamyl-phosphate reductase [Candidatus Thermoplasmatota archaeon]